MVAETIKEKKIKSTFKMYIICGIIGYVYFLLAALNYIAIRNMDRRITMEEAINEALTRVITDTLGFLGHVTFKDFITIILLSALAAFMGYIYHCDHKLKKHDNPDTVNGDAHWMNLKEYKDFCVKRCSPIGEESINGYDNMIFSKEIRMSMNGIKCKRNCNTLVIGGSGSGKSRNYAGPNILNANCCNIITDPSGELYRDYAQYLYDCGYEVKVFNLTDVYKSSRYNPFHYITKEEDIFIMTNTIMENTTPPDQHGGDPFWPKAETLLISALMLYLWHTQPKEEQTFSNLLFLISCAEIDENDSSKKSVLDQMFFNLEKEDPDNLAVAQYKGFKLGAGKTLKSILISVKARLQIFELSDIKHLTSRDTLELDKFADKMQVLFVIIPTADDTFNFIVSMMYTQLFMSLYRYCETRSSYGWGCAIKNDVTIKVAQAATKAESAAAKAEIERFVAEIKKGVTVEYDSAQKVNKVYTKETKELVGWRGSDEMLSDFLRQLSHIKIKQIGSACPNHVRLLGDEFANISSIPNLDKRLSTVRKYNISISIILQAITQLKKMYKDDWNTIAGNCDVKLFLGSSDNETIKWLCETGGKKTTRVQNLNFGGKHGMSEAINLSSYDLITPDLLSLMGDDDCLVLIRAERPYYGKKYEIEDHPMYAYAGIRNGMYEAKSTLPEDKVPVTIPLRERLELKKGLEDFEKTKQKRLKFIEENNVQKNKGKQAKEEQRKIQEETEKRVTERINDEEAIERQQAEALSEMLGEAETGKKGMKKTPEQINDMSDEGIQEIIESRITIEPYSLDEWVYRMV